MPRSDWEQLKQRAKELESEAKIITTARHDLAKLLEALKPFAQAFAELPEQMKRETWDRLREYGLSAYNVKHTHVVVRIGEQVLRSGDLALAAHYHDLHTKAPEPSEEA